MKSVYSTQRLAAMCFNTENPFPLLGRTFPSQLKGLFVIKELCKVSPVNHKRCRLSGCFCSVRGVQLDRFPDRAQGCPRLQLSLLLFGEPLLGAAEHGPGLSLPTALQDSSVDLLR